MAERKARSLKLKRAVVPALAVIVVVAVVAVLTSPLVPGIGRGGDAKESATSSTSLPEGASAAPTSNPTIAAASGSSAAAGARTGLLVVRQAGKPAVILLISGSAKAGVVVGMPGITLLKSGDRFTMLADLFTSDAPDPASAPAEAFARTLGAVASIDWAGLRSALAWAPGGDKMPELLDPRGADAGVLAAALAASLSSAANGAGGTPWWESAALGSNGDAFRNVLASAREATVTGDWRGQALPGELVEYEPGAWYFAPDPQAIQNLLADSSAVSSTGSTTGRVLS